MWLATFDYSRDNTRVGGGRESLFRKAGIHQQGWHRACAFRPATLQSRFETSLANLRCNPIGHMGIVVELSDMGEMAHCRASLRAFRQFMSWVSEVRGAQVANCDTNPSLLGSRLAKELLFRHTLGFEAPQNFVRRRSEPRASGTQE